MKKFWIVLLSLGLIVAFSMPVCAADVKFSGSYYVEGLYDNNHSLKDPAVNTGAASTQFFAQRLRMQPQFKVAEGLTLVTRFDALEKKWGDQTWSGSTQYDVTNRQSTGVTGARTEENIEFENAYVDFNTGIGRFLVGYQNAIAFGTDFMDSNATRPGIKYMYTMGNTTIIAALEQIRELTSTGESVLTQGSYADADNTAYDIGAIQKWQGGEAGLLIQYMLVKSNRTSTTAPYQQAAWVFDPYVKATFGNFYVEAEALYATGDFAKYEGAGTTNADITISAWAAYIHAKGTFGPAYVGAMFAYIPGDDPNTATKIEGNLAAAFAMGQVFSPCLIMWNDPHATWLGPNAGYVSGTNKTGTANSQGNFMDNAVFYGIYGGYKPVPKLDIKAALYYATAQQKPQDTGVNYIDSSYGTEFDLTATYKIYDNLSYMVGLGYLWTGDFFKGTNATAQLQNDYQISHKLTLSF